MELALGQQAERERVLARLKYDHVRLLAAQFSHEWRSNATLQALLDKMDRITGSKRGNSDGDSDGDSDSDSERQARRDVVQKLMQEIIKSLT